MAVRGALGASTARLVLQFVADGIVLAGVGGGLGIASAFGAIRLLTALVPKDILESMPFLQGLGLNVRSLSFSLALLAGAVVVFSLTPALRWRSSKVREDLAEGGRSAAGTAWRRLGSHLVVVELAMAMLLLTGGGLLGKSFYYLLHADIGMRPDHLAALQVSPSTSAYSKPEKALALEQDILARVAGLPGVKSAATTSRLPLGDADFTSQFIVVGRPDDDVSSRQLPFF
jgi:macrolide transport system ATP-binding/permease protein